VKNHKPLRRILIAIAIVFASPQVMAQADCSKEIAEIDKRIAAGSYPEMNVEVAQQVQGSLQQMCAYLDDGTKASIMEQLEDLLPTLSEEERRAQQKASPHRGELRCFVAGRWLAHAE